MNYASLKTNIEDIWFISLLDELADFGLRNTDRAMAFGLCLIHNLDNYNRRVINIDEQKQDVGFVYYKMGASGIPQRIKE